MRMVRVLFFVLFTIFFVIPVDAQKKDSINNGGYDRKRLTIEDVEYLETKKFPINIIIFIDQYIPYCGGASPSEEQMNNYQAFGNTDFVLVNIETGEKIIVKTDSTGHLNLSLPIGKYGIKEIFKNCTFQEFYQNALSQSNSYIQEMDEECYRNWWSSYLGEFSITESTSVIKEHYSTSQGCFTGNNPCIIYTGPYPP